MKEYNVFENNSYTINYYSYCDTKKNQEKGCLFRDVILQNDITKNKMFFHEIKGFFSPILDDVNQKKCHRVIIKNPSFYKLPDDVKLNKERMLKAKKELELAESCDSIEMGKRSPMNVWLDKETIEKANR